MFIMTRINIQKDVVCVFDTSDESNESIRLSRLAGSIRSGEIQVAGISLVSGYVDSTPVPSYGIYISWVQAKQAMAQYYIHVKKMNPRDAYARLGLTPS